jgi:cysteine desulfurase / selenocysteine lyase
VSFSAARQDFPITFRRAYLNAAAMAPLSNRVVGAVNAMLGDMQLNGRNNVAFRNSFMEKTVRPNVAALFGARPSEIAFVKHTTEGLNIIANSLSWEPGDNIVIANIEYPSNVYCWLNLARYGVEVRWIDAKADGGRVRVDSIREAVDGRTKLVSVSSVQFNTGFRQDMELTGQFCHERGILLAYDAIQMAGAFPIDASRYHFDFLAAGGHKWLTGPMGTGLLFCRENVIDRLHPAAIGPGSLNKDVTDLDYDISRLHGDARRFEEAVLNYPGLWGLNAAVTTLRELGVEAISRHILELNGQAAEGLKRLGFEVLSPWASQERSGILCFRHPAIDSDFICKTLEAQGVDLVVRNGNLRLSSHFYNDAGDVAALLSAIPH